MEGWARQARRSDWIVVQAMTPAATVSAMLAPPGAVVITRLRLRGIAECEWVECSRADLGPHERFAGREVGFPLFDGLRTVMNVPQRLKSAAGAAPAKVCSVLWSLRTRPSAD